MFASPLVKRLVQLALEEDLAYGDITADLTVPADHHSSARIIAREDLLVAGLPLLEMIVREGGGMISVTLEAGEGDEARDGTVLARLKGPTRKLLALERTMLNFLQRMSGVATRTKTICRDSDPLMILDTRKTLPGWRVLDKYSVMVGGGRNHRLSLGDMVLVKNNHIDAHGGGIECVLEEIVNRKPPYMAWEVEVRDLQELAVAIRYRPTIIMLDNFSDELVRQAVPLIQATLPAPLIEVSGGITPERIQRLKTMGVDAVSLGSLTTAARNVDISMRIDRP